jgi:hypothetical protein
VRRGTARSSESRFLNARWLLDRDGHLTITRPHEVRVEASDLTGALP